MADYIIGQLPEALKHRSPLMGPSVVRWLNAAKCWHLDVWLYTDESGLVFVQARQANGLGEVIASNWYLLQLDAFGLWELLAVEYHGDTSRLRARVLNDPPMIRHIGGPDMFRQLWGQLYRLTGLWNAVQYPRRSMKFHCLEPLGVFDPMEGVLNHYDSTGRAQRDTNLKHRAAVAKKHN